MILTITQYAQCCANMLMCVDVIIFSTCPGSLPNCPRSTNINLEVPALSFGDGSAWLQCPAQILSPSSTAWCAKLLLGQ